MQREGKKSEGHKNSPLSECLKSAFIAILQDLGYANLKAIPLSSAPIRMESLDIIIKFRGSLRLNAS